MTEPLLELVATYGTATIFISAFLSCLLVPIPTSFLMLAGGAFSATGDLSLWQVVGAAYLGAVAGDQVGFRIGRAFGPSVARFAGRRESRARAYRRATLAIETHGGFGVFLTTWLFAPIGPWANLAAGAGGLGALRFTIWDAMGEAIWVTGYTGLGYAFASDIAALGSALGNWVGFLTAGGITVILGYLLLQRLRNH